MHRFKKFTSLFITMVLFISFLPVQPSLAEDSPIGVYSLADLNLADGDAVPPAEEGKFGVVAGDAGSVIFKKDPEGDYARLITGENPPDCVPSLGFVLSDNTAGSTITVEFELRISEGTLVNDKYFTFGFDDGIQGPGFDNFIIRNIFNNNCQISPKVDPFQFTHDVQSPYETEGGIQNDKWYSFKMVVNTKTGTYDMYVGGTLMFTQAYSGDIKRFLIAYGNWSSWHKPNPALTYDIRNLKITLDEAGGEPAPDPYPDPGIDPWTPPAGAENTWYLKDQLTTGNYNNGDPLVQYNENNPGVFSAYYARPGDGTIEVKGDQGNQYVELAYTTGTKDRGSPAFVMDLPETINNGTVVVNFQMLITNGTTWDWLEAGFGTDALGSSNLFAAKIVYTNGTHMLETSSGWKGLGSYTQGQWYRYVLTADLSLQRMSLDIYAPGDQGTPSQRASYDMSAKEVKRFVIKPIATSPDHVGAIRIKDVAVSYVPPEKKPTLLAPAQGALLVPLKPTFKWSNTGADSYTLEISKTADFSEGVTVISNLTQNSYTMETELDEHTTYYWRVTSIFAGEPTGYTSAVFNFISDIEVPADNIYNAGDFGLIEGDWDKWPDHPGVADVPRHNAAIIQALLDKAGRSGGGKVILPEGTYCISGDPSIVGGACLTIRYDNITLTGQGKNENGEYKTKLKTNYKWDGPNGVFRSSGIRIDGEPFGSNKARQNIEISNFEMDGGRGWSGKYDWGYDPTVDYGWDINHKGIIVAADTLVTHVTLDNLYVHSYSGETLYVGGLYVGYLEVKNCILADTNASCFNLYAACLNVHDNQFGAPDEKCRFWIEYCARASAINYEMPPIPEGLEKDHAYFYNNKFYNAVGAHGVAIAQGDCTTYAISFENNFFDNSLAGPDYGLFQFGGAVYGPIIIKNNTIQNFPGSLMVFDYGGGTVPPDHLMNKNIYFEDNQCTNVGGPFIHLLGTWGIWDPVQNKAVPAVQPVENLVVRNNYFEGSTKNSKSVAIGNSWDMIESAVDLNKVEISGNTFKNCTTPEELRVFKGNVPLFFNNKYIDVVNTEFGGISNITPDAPQIKPVFEYLVVNATSTVSATMRTGKNEDGQQVTITGGPGTAPVIFRSTENSFEIPTNQIVVGPGDSVVFKYDAAKEKWIYISFIPYNGSTIPPSVEQPIGEKDVDEAIRDSSQSGKVELSAPEGQSKLVLTNQQAKKIAETDKSVVLHINDDVGFTLTPKALTALIDSTTVQLVFEATKVDDSNMQRAAQEAAYTNVLRLTSNIYNFAITAISYDGSRSQISQFSTPLTITITVPEKQKRSATVGRVIACRIDETNNAIKELECSYDANAGTISAVTSSFSKYALFEKPLIRLGGVDRFETSAITAQQYYPKAKTAILAGNINDFADGLAASTLAGVIKAPVLLTEKGYVPKAVLDYLKAAGVKTIYIIGGPDAISPTVEKALSGYKIERIYGNNREDTAVEVAKKAKALGGQLKDTALIVNGYAPADALAVGPTAAQGMPLLIVTHSGIPQATKNALKDLGIKNVIIVGDTGVVSEAVANELKELINGSVERIGGADRIETSIELAKKLNMPNVMIVGYDGLPDAVAAGYAGALEEGAVVYTEAKVLNDTTEGYLGEIVDADAMISILGGTGVVGANVENYISNKIKAAK